MSLFDKIPWELRKLHEEGQVVFFCGAGVSKGAGLPTFWEMVEKTTIKLVGKEALHPNDPVWKALNENKLDEALDLLERDNLHGHGSRMRKHIRGQLRKRPKSLDNHFNLCRLAGLDTKQGRLVTTNLESLFDKALKKLKKLSKSKVRKHVDFAPSLPPPREDSWHSLLYIHGRLDNPADNGGDQNLVLTTADFGRAYLVDRWASKFVSELFRNFHVVFIGYSLEDPTMNYLVKALAADRDGVPGAVKSAFTFAPYGGPEESEPNTPKEAVELWDRKGVVAIPYNSDNQHEELWTGIDEWADIFRGGGEARRSIVAKLGQYAPIGPQAEDHDMLAWALTDDEGKIAELCARPSSDDDRLNLHIKWLPILAKKGLFNVALTGDGERLNRSLVSNRGINDQLCLHPVSVQMGRWLATNLHEPEALEWVLNQGGILHRTLRWEVLNALEKDLQLESPRVPGGLRKVWFQLAQHEYAYTLASRLEHSYQSFKINADNPQSLHFFLRMLHPVPIFSRKYIYGGNNSSVTDQTRASSYCEIEIHLVGIDDKHHLDEIKSKAEDWVGSLAQIADELTSLLVSAMSWQEAFDEAYSDADRTYIEFRSISEHSQNENADTWTVLIALARDAYDALSGTDSVAAERLVRRWSKINYPVFKRLVLHAITGGKDD